MEGYSGETRMSIHNADTARPNPTSLVRVAAVLIIVFSAIAAALLATVLMRTAGPTAMRGFILLVLANLAANIVLAVLTLKMRLWAYYTLLVALGLGIFLQLTFHGKPPAVAALSFILMLAGHNGYVAMCKQPSGPAIEPEYERKAA
jgi:hypothetical protein